MTCYSEKGMVFILRGTYASYYGMLFFISYTVILAITAGAWQLFHQDWFRTVPFCV